MEPLYLYGCRHDILGHYLKAIGLLRVLSLCANEANRDPDAEGWWDLDHACFCLRSPKYPTKEKLVEFFALHYRPTGVFAAWNKESGCDSAGAKKLGVNLEWLTANQLSKQVVSAEERKKPANRHKLIGSEALESYRDAATASVREAMDAVVAPFVNTNSEHPLFLAKGIAGRAHLWRTHWEYLLVFHKHRTGYEKAAEKVRSHSGTAAQLLKLKEKVKTAEKPLAELLPFESRNGGESSSKGKGTPFFPDAIKAYNIGSGWVTENYPFNALDYVLAVEGGFAMRGSVGRTLAANSKRFAAFPFVFDAGDELVDDGNEVKGTARALWFPLWSRPVTFAELSSFISDAQARLPGKDARFSAEFMRALHSQGVDAGFAGWQEFRFKMMISRVPWVTTGSYVESAFREDATCLNRALHPLDESHFLDQFEIAWKGNKAAARSPHPVRAEINAAMETAVHEATPHNCLELLATVFRACRQMAISESFRDTLPGKRAHFFRPLPMEDWNVLFAKFDHPEFRIARAVASMVGLLRQQDGKYSKTLPTFGSILPLNLGPTGWYLATKGDRSHQAVWSGADLCHDLAAVLERRYMDSLTDDRPALVSAYGAPLDDVLAFLREELDDHLIARWTEALSFIEWRLIKVEEPATSDGEWESLAIPPEYAALRGVLELECEPREEGDRKKRRSQQPISLLCQRSASTLPLAVTEALRWIGIWGFTNPYGTKAEAEKKRLSGRDIISLQSVALSFSTDAARLAAAVCIPLHWRDRNALYRAVSLPQSD
jgi:CRISPR-associated protein Csx17